MGKSFLEFALDMCFEREVDVISLEVRKSNVKAQILYEKYGFMKEQVRKQYYSDGEDAYLMVKTM